MLMPANYIKTSILVFISALFSILLSSCSDQQKAESTVKEYLKSHLDDPGSYESISFSTLEPVYNDFETESKEYPALKIVVDSMDSKRNYYRHLIDSINADPFNNKQDTIKYVGQFKRWERKTDSLLQIIDKKSKAYKGSLLGYKLNHKFRAKNAFGALQLEFKEFNLDKKLNEVYLAIDQ
jgi:hypothetical protein